MGCHAQAHQPDQARVPAAATEAANAHAAANSCRLQMPGSLMDWTLLNPCIQWERFAVIDADCFAQIVSNSIWS